MKTHALVDTFNRQIVSRHRSLYLAERAQRRFHKKLDKREPRNTLRTEIARIVTGGEGIKARSDRRIGVGELEAIT